MKTHCYVWYYVEIMDMDGSVPCKALMPCNPIRSNQELHVHGRQEDQQEGMIRDNNKQQGWNPLSDI
jgi:hypothetical protein